jgi:hypothetical protein
MLKIFKYKFLILFALCGFSAVSKAQLSVKEIIDTKCVKCHRPQGGAPFVLDNYQDINKRKRMIKYVIQDDIMPPWPADREFASYANENYLTQEEKEQIITWLDAGAPRADYANVTEDVTSIKPNSIEHSDLIYSLTEPFEVPGSGQENYIVYVIPLNNDDTLNIKGIGYIPGQSGLTHHVRFMIDTTNLLRKDNGISVGSDSEYGRLNVQLEDQFFYGWLPGNFMTDYGADRLKFIPPHSDLVLNVHYSPSAVPIIDDPKIVFRLGEHTETTKEVLTLTMDENNISNQPFYIPKDTIVTFYSRSVLVPYDIELVSVMPHMHLLGQSAKVFAITSEGDFIPLVNIPEWNFDWQFTYMFPPNTVLPKNSVIYGEFSYDNTENNVSNPFAPPQNAKYGWGTNDEMMNIVIDYIIK